MTKALKQIKTLQAESPKTLAQESAFFIHHFSTRHHDPHKERWSQFPSYESFRDYRLGQSFEYQEKFAEATEKYMAAAKNAPNNAEVRLRCGAILEKQGFDLKGGLIDPLTIYLLIFHHWPEFLEARYRLAITLSFKKLFEDYENLHQGRTE